MLSIWVRALPPLQVKVSRPYERKSLFEKDAPGVSVLKKGLRTCPKKKKKVAPVKKVFYLKMPLVWGGGIKLLPEWWIPIALSSRAWSWPANKCDGNYAFIFSGRHFHQSKRERQWKVITLPAWLRCSHSQASLLQQVHWNKCLEPVFFYVHYRLSTVLTKQAHWPGITIKDEF